MIYPWQTDQWQQLMRAKSEKRLPHALLFAGIAGTGKAQFAEHLTRALLCQKPEACFKNDDKDIFECHACRLVAGRVHPNVQWVEPEKPGHAIKVDQVRAVSEFVSQSSLQGEYRVVIINPANNMNASAANALLKTLEEPSSGALLILVSDQSAQLPATILSRCQRIIFPRPASALAMSWLKARLPADSVDPELLLRVAHGAPLSALKLLEGGVLTLRQDLFAALYGLVRKTVDPVKTAANFQDGDTLTILDFLLAWLLDLLRLQLSGDVDRILNKDHEAQLSELKLATGLTENTRLLVYLQQVRRQLCAGLNLNKQLVLESILIRWMGCSHVPG